jgi:uncharacterized protein (DUF1778 family)
MPYIPSMPKKRDGIMTFRIPTDEKDMIQAIADKANVTLSDVVVRAVRDLIEVHADSAKKGTRKKVAA